jgi:integrase
MPRRGNAVTQRKDGLWQATYELPSVEVDARGKRIRQRRYAFGSTMAEAMAARTQAVVDLKGGNGSASPTPEMPLGQWLDKWVGIMSTAKGWKPATVRNYTDVIEAYVRPICGRVRLAALTSEDVRRMLGQARKNGQPLSTSTQKRIWAIVSAALDAAKVEKLVADNVARVPTATPPKVTTPEAPSLTAEQIKEILAELRATENWLYPLFQLAVSVGIRQGEALALRWSDVDWAKSEISIQGTMDRTERKTVATKTAKSRRTLKVGPEVSEALRWQQDHQANKGSKDLVFTSDQGTPVYDSTLRRTWKGLCRKLGINLDDNGDPTMTWYDLRHTAAYLMLQAGVPVEQVAWRLGESSLAMILKVYGWTSTARYEDAAEAMTAALS